MSNSDHVEQLFQDDPWLRPFEGEIRRRYEIDTGVTLTFVIPQLRNFREKICYETFLYGEIEN